MKLNFEIQQWKAETDFMTATITRKSDGKLFEWDIYSKIEKQNITGGVEMTLVDAKSCCLTAAVTIADAEGYRFS